MWFNFPEIMTTRTVEEQKQKILDEIQEYERATGIEKDREAIDILNAVETFLHVHFRGRESLINIIVEETKVKNTARGYYAKRCF